MKTSVASTFRHFLLRLASVAMIVLGCALISRGGGPKDVAGPVYFDSTVTGQPLRWAQGSITYYSDQGDLSGVLPNASANSLVADAFSQWTSVPTAALSASNGGLLAENVSGANVTVNSDGTISMPIDIQATATGTPIGVVYDSDGAVTSALLGAGAGNASQCFFNAVFGGNDNYGSLATYQHALIVINGQCAQQSAQLPDIEYRLLRVIGSVLGVGWSQLNPNVQTGSPPATSDDYAGFPVMHFRDLSNCVPMTLCYPNPYQLSMDDIAAVSRLYPVTSQNQSAFPGKQIFSTTTARIHGSVWFTDTHGLRTQPMQGVNVVARWIDPRTGLPSRRYAASSVSGFLFTGNEGNPITGTDDALGDPLAEWGSDNQAMEGFFDLAGLQLPGGSSAQYQLTVEGVDSLRSAGVGPYSPGPVSPSGSFQPITVTVSAGSDLERDILMAGTSQPLPEATSSWSAPADLPAGGDWISSLRYDAVDYFLVPVQSNRTLSIAVTALDESGHASELKAQPVIGIWSAGDPEGTPAPAFTPSPFNSAVSGMTRLDAQVLQSSNFLVGISDVRGDGRPDFRYHARVLYADSVSPRRISVNGGAITIHGIGFSSGLNAKIGSTAAAKLSMSAGQMTLWAPAHADGIQDISIADPVSGSSTVMTGVLTYGAASTDNIVLMYTGNPQTPVGVQAAKPVTVRVLAADGVTPVGGATVGWTTSNNLQLSACGGSSTCSVITDQRGMATTWVTPAAVGVATTTATLAPGVYSPAKSVTATVNAIESSSDIGVLMPYLWISQGATVTVPLTARALNNGTPRSGVQVNFKIVSGSGSLSAPSALTNSNGYASLNLSVTQIAALVQVSVCIAPGNAPCAVYYVNPVPLSQQTLQAIAGAGQVSTGTQAFQLLIVRVVDSSSIPNAVIAAPVLFQTTVLRAGGTSSGGGDGESNPGNPAMPVILQVSQSSTTTDMNGLASLVPLRANFSPPVEVDVAVTAGSGALLDFPLQVLPAPATGTSPPAENLEPVFSPVREPLWRGQNEN